MNIQNIKLIIWDLDETFWRGTITEGKITFLNENIAFLKKTTDMGIVHSICSKNSFSVVKETLLDAGLWDYFIFPSISWEGKGARVKQIIATANLRPENVLFVDDNILNLEEAKYFCKGIMTASPDGLAELYEQAEKAKPTDTDHKRLEQYRVLERKETEKNEYASNEAFLAASNIRVSIHYDCLEQADRIADLVARSNQLNYTKNRQNKEDLLALIQSPEVSAGYVSASDKYGDYGIIGFFAVRNNKLIHFVFSCRTLGMKIEQYVYYRLGCPELTVVGEVAAVLNTTENPEWINQTQVNIAQAEKESIHKKILLKGPCDMSQIFSFICDNEYVTTEFSYTNDAGILVEGHNHTSQIVTSLCARQEQKDKLLSRFKFFDKDQFTTSMLAGEFDYVVLSMLTDGNLGVYKSKSSDECVALCEKHYDLTDANNRQLYVDKKIFTSNIAFTERELDDFSACFDYVENNGDMTVHNLTVIREKLPDTAKLVLLLGSEREFTQKCSPSYENRHLEHREMNQKIRAWAEKHENVIILEFDHYIKSEADYLDTINHFVKRVYYSLACDLVSVFNGDAEKTIAVKGKGSLYTAELIQQLKRFKQWMEAKFLKR